MMIFSILYYIGKCVRKSRMIPLILSALQLALPLRMSVPESRTAPSITQAPTNTPLPSIAPLPSIMPLPSITPSPTNTPAPSNTPSPESAAAQKIALTFDDGPSASVTPRILDTLAKHGIKATFFVQGWRAEKYPQIVKRIQAEGHVVGNHAYDHKRLTTLSESKVGSSIKRCSRILENILGEAPAYFRPPYGRHNASVTDTLKDLDMKMVLWSVDSHDWLHPGTDEMVTCIAESVDGNEIILLHDIHASTADALEAIITMLAGKGCVFVTVPELGDKSPSRPPPIDIGCLNSAKYS